MYHWLFNNQSFELGGNDNIIQDREIVFKKNPTLFFRARLLSPNPILFNSGIFSFQVMTVN